MSNKSIEISSAGSRSGNTSRGPECREQAVARAAGRWRQGARVL